MITKLKNKIVFVSGRLNGVAGGIVIALMVLTTSDVFLRYLFNRPVRGTYDVSGLMALVIISLALAQTQLKKGHISITILLTVLPKKIEILLQAAIDFICFLASVGVAWQSWIYAISLASVGEASQTEKIPFAPFVYTISAGFIVLSLVLLISVVESINKEFKNESH